MIARNRISIIVIIIEFYNKHDRGEVRRNEEEEDKKKKKRRISEGSLYS